MKVDDCTSVIGKHKIIHFKKVEFLSLGIFAITLVLTLSPLPPAFAVVTLGWEFPAGYSLNDGAVDAPASVFFNVTDTTFAGDAIANTITVTVTSIIPGGATRDSITMTLFEIDSPDAPPLGRNPDPNSGIFGITNIVFNPDTPRFSLGNTVKISQQDTSGGKATNGVVDTISVTVKSTTDSTGISRTLTETGPNTGFFQATISLTSTASVPNSSIQVSAGNILTVSYLGLKSNAAIIPSPDGSVGGLKADVGDTVRISYSGSTADSVICVCGGGGGGGGGLIRPELVLDVVASINDAGGSRGDVSPPSFTINRLSLLAQSIPDYVIEFISSADPFTALFAVNKSEYDLPLQIGENGFPLFGYSQTIETQVVETGKNIPIELIMYDSTGIEHIALYTNVAGIDGDVYKSDTYIIYDEDKPLQISDPHDLFLKINFTESDEGSKYTARFDIVFAKPMDTSNIIFRIWDPKRNSADTKIFDAIKVVGQPIIMQQTVVETETSSIFVPYYKDPKFQLSFINNEGLLVRHDSFGNVELKQTKPYYAPVVYPSYVGRNERFDDGFNNLLAEEKMKAERIAEFLTIEPFTKSDKLQNNFKYHYPSNVGKLDRENKPSLENALFEQNEKAKTLLVRYKTNHSEE